jgi:outer membrane receptor protein involved in Fe transport
MQGIDVRRLLAFSLLASALPSLAISAAAGADAAQDEELELVVVTGSRIPTIQAEGPSPVTTITAEQIQARGFTTIQEVANSLTQITGTAQNETMGGSFTQNANSLELRGLGPGRTLILIDGRRVADYPLPYNGESNFVNLSTIPAAAVERVELLSSGASAIYGSDAVAGVLNIVLKKKLDSPLSVDVRQGFTSQGGGASTRVQAVTGGEVGGLNILFAGEVFDRKPIYGYQRKFQDSIYDDPTSGGEPVAARALVRLDPFDLDDDGDLYIDPGEAACAPFSQSTSYALRPGFGHYCGQYDDPAQGTIRNARKRASAFTRLSYDLGNVELYSNLSYSSGHDRADTNYSWFSTTIMPLSDSGYIFDTSYDPIGLGGTVAGLQRFFHTWEMGGVRARQERWEEQVFDYSVGARGDIVRDWKYDLTLGGSRYDLQDYRPFLLNQRLIDYYLGEQLGVVDLGDPGDPFLLPAFNVNWDRFYTPMTPGLWQQLSQVDRQTAQSRSKSATLVLNGSIVDLPAGPLASAVVLEAASQSYDISLSDALANGDYFGIVATGGGGKRDRYAAGLELSVPVIDQVRLQLAGRYDNYDDITKVNSAFTYNAGIEYRPIQQLLIRGSYATSFRAPDMHYVFADPSGFFTTLPDEYLCRRDEPGVSLSLCTVEANPEGARQGNPLLKEETSKSYTFGFVAQPLRGLTFTADYYNIKVDDAVKDDSASLLLQTEADCRLGETSGGVPVDINSLQCQSALARVQRRPADGSTLSEELIKITTGPINSAVLKTSGIDLALQYALTAGSWGGFDFDANYTQVLSSKTQDFAGDPVKNGLKDLQNFDWHSRISGGVTWKFGDVSTSVFVQRFGSVPNWAETGRIGSWTIANLSGRYSGLLGGDAYLGFAINNVLNRKPPRDETYDTYPYYSDFNYSPVGREVFLEIGTHL